MEIVWEVVKAVGVVALIAAAVIGAGECTP